MADEMGSMCVKTTKLRQLIEASDEKEFCQIWLLLIHRKSDEEKGEEFLTERWFIMVNVDNGPLVAASNHNFLFHHGLPPMVLIHEKTYMNKNINKCFLASFRLYLSPSLSLFLTLPPSFYQVVFSFTKVKQLC